jgi:hypothetical protein
VGVQSIVAENTLLGTTSFTATGGNHLSVIDSSVPHLWLPQAVCDLMATALGLSYDPQSDLYLVNDTIHTQLVSKNPTFTFKLGNTQYDNGNSTNIVLPYAAFDLKVGWPVYSSDQNYFPIRRANSTAQYTLGRALLQEAYLVVDFERQNFTVGQAIFPDPAPSSRIVTISSPSTTHKSSSSISTGAIAGIAVGAAVIVLGLVALFFFLTRKKKQKKQKAAELEAISKTNAEGIPDRKYEHNEDGAVEIGAEAGHQVVELPAAGSGYHKDHKESYGPHNFASELPSPAPVFEMEGDSSHTPTSTYNRSPSPYQPSPTR